MPGKFMVVEEQAPQSDRLLLLVRRILASPPFQRSQRLSQLLEYLSEQTLLGARASLKEAAIGQTVFGRSPTYNAAEDNIVRSNIRQLRLKLEEYYSLSGAEDEWRISIPKGAYEVILERRPERVSASLPELPALTALPRDHSRSLLRIVLPAAICLLAGLLLGYFSRSSVLAEKVKPVESLLSLLDPGPGRRLLVVIPDAGVQLYQRLTNRTVHLQDYVSGKFEIAGTSPPLPPLLAQAAADVFHASTTQSFVLHLIPPLQKAIAPVELSIHHPSTLGPADFERDNALLISGPFGNPWVQLFDPQLNFQITYDPASRITKLVNTHPQAGEQNEYANYVNASRSVVCYARLAYLPGLGTASRLLLVGGPHHISTEAAALFVTQPNILEQVCRLFHVATPSRLPWFELVVESRALGDAAWESRIIAHREVPKSIATGH